MEIVKQRVLGNGRFKGHIIYLRYCRIQRREQKKIETMQQLYWDMVLDESKYGFISNYNQTIFFRRADNALDKTLEFSPTILLGESPLIAFLFVLF